MIQKLVIVSVHHQSRDTPALGKTRPRFLLAHFAVSIWRFPPNLKRMLHSHSSEICSHSEVMTVEKVLSGSVIWFSLFGKTLDVRFIRTLLIIWFATHYHSFNLSHDKSERELDCFYGPPKFHKLRAYHSRIFLEPIMTNCYFFEKFPFFSFYGETTKVNFVTKMRA